MTKCPGCGEMAAPSSYVPSSVECADCRRDKRLERTYELSWSERDYLAAKQNDRCALCGRHPAYELVVDHSHLVAERYGKGASVRGLCCHLCNTYLGLVDAGEVVLGGEARHYIESYAKRLTEWVSAEVAHRVEEHLAERACAST